MKIIPSKAIAAVASSALRNWTEISKLDHHVYVARSDADDGSLEVDRFGVLHLLLDEEQENDDVYGSTVDALRSTPVGRGAVLVGEYFPFDPASIQAREGMLSFEVASGAVKRNFASWNLVLRGTKVLGMVAELCAIVGLPDERVVLVDQSLVSSPPIL